MTFVGKGTPHGRVGQVSTYKVVVGNLGPGTAHEVRISFGMGDQFNRVRCICESGHLHDGLSSVHTAKP